MRRLLLQVLPELPDRGSLCAHGEAAQGPLAPAPPWGCPEDTLGLGLENRKSRTSSKFFP